MEILDFQNCWSCYGEVILTFGDFPFINLFEFPKKNPLETVKKIPTFFVLKIQTRVVARTQKISEIQKKLTRFFGNLKFLGKKYIQRVYSFTLQAIFHFIKFWGLALFRDRRFFERGAFPLQKILRLSFVILPSFLTFRSIRHAFFHDLSSFLLKNSCSKRKKENEWRFLVIKSNFF